MINNPYKIARDAIMLRCDFTIEDVKKPRSEHNPFKPGKILKKFNADLAKQINVFRKIKKLTKAQILEGCESQEFQNVFLEKEEDELFELIDKCELTKYKTIENLFDFSERFEIKTLDAFAVFSGYLGWADMDFNERFSFREIRESEKQNEVDNSISQEVQEIQLGIGELKQIVQDIQENETKIIPKELTVNLPRIRANQIIGRQKEIEDLRKRLFDNNEVVLVNGMGGIGKTTVVAVYATENSSAYKHIAWISLFSSDFLIDFISTPGLLDNFNIVRENKTKEQLYYETTMALKSIKDTPCLLVIDNADMGLVKYYNSLPNQPNWHVLITSREDIPYFDIKELGFLKEKDAFKLFEKNYKREDVSDEEIKSIVKEVDYHTLVIEVLAKTANHRRIQPKYIIKSIEDDIEADVTTRHSTGKIEKITSYLCSIFKLSSLSKHEKWLYSNLSCLPPIFHSYDSLNVFIQSEKAKEVDFAKTLSNLARKGWLLYDKTTDSYKLHRILIDVISTSLIVDSETVKTLISNITLNLSVDQSKENPTDKFGWIPYGKAILKQFATDTSTSIAELQNTLAIILKESGDYKGAKILIEKVMESNEKNFGKDHPATAVSYSNLASLLEEFGDYEGATSLLNKAIELNERALGKDHPSTAITYTNMASILLIQGEYQRAKKLLEKVIEINEKNFGLDHPTTANDYSNLGILLRDVGDYKGAKELLVKATKSNERNFGKNHPSTATSYSNLATIVWAQGDLQRAKKLMENVIEIEEKNFGPHHPVLSIRYSNLGLVLNELGDYKGAKKLLVEAVELDKNYFGLDHASTGRSYSNLAVVLQTTDDNVGAKELLVKAKEIAEKNFGIENPTTAISYSNLAYVLINLGEYKEAKTLLIKAKKIGERKLGITHPTTISIINNLESLVDY